MTVRILMSLSILGVIGDNTMYRSGSELYCYNIVPLTYMCYLRIGGNGEMVLNYQRVPVMLCVKKKRRIRNGFARTHGLILMDIRVIEI